MNKKKLFYTGLLVLVLSLSLVFITCELGGGEGGGGEEETGLTRAATPLITGQPKDATYFTGEAVQNLTITVGAPSDGGTLTYQWYSNTAFKVEGGTLVSGGTNASITPTIDTSEAGAVIYYYVVITNTNPEMEVTTATVNSKVVKLSVIEDTSAGKVANATITVYPNTKYQYVRGFGGMDVAWGQFPSMSMEDMETMFNPDKLGYNMYRMMILPFNTDPGLTMEQLIANEIYPDSERQYQLEFVKMVNKYGGYVLASPWTPPAEWKTNGELSGRQGSLKSEYYDAYADYLFDFCKYMYNAGAPVYAVSIQNEPNYEDDYDGCVWTASQMRDFFKKVGRFTKGVKGYGGHQEIASVKTMNGETANNPSINDAALDDPVSRAAIDLIGRHIYGSVRSIYQKAKDHNKEIWMTEHNINSSVAASYPNDSTYNYVWKFMNDVDLVIRMNQENAFIWWAMKRFYSFIGDGQYASTDGAILPRGYGLSQYAKFATEMYHIKMDIEGTISGGGSITTSNFNPPTTFNVDSTAVKASAFVSADGDTISLVMFTPTSTSGGSGVNMGTIKIQLPAGFTASGAVAMRTSSGSYAQYENVVLDTDRNSAYVDMPAGHILSVRFTK